MGNRNDKCKFIFVVSFFKKKLVNYLLSKKLMGWIPAERKYSREKFSMRWDGVKIQNPGLSIVICLSFSSSQMKVLELAVKKAPSTDWSSVTVSPSLRPRAGWVSMPAWGTGLIHHSYSQLLQVHPGRTLSGQWRPEPAWGGSGEEAAVPQP